MKEFHHVFIRKNRWVNGTMKPWQEGNVVSVPPLSSVSEAQTGSGWEVLVLHTGLVT